MFQSIYSNFQLLVSFIGLGNLIPIFIIILYFYVTYKSKTLKKIDENTSKDKINNILTTLKNSFGQLVNNKREAKIHNDKNLATLNVDKKDDFLYIKLKLKIIEDINSIELDNNNLSKRIEKIFNTINDIKDLELLNSILYKNIIKWYLINKDKLNLDENSIETIFTNEVKKIDELDSSDENDEDVLNILKEYENKASDDGGNIKEENIKENDKGGSADRTSDVDRVMAKVGQFLNGNANLDEEKLAKINDMFESVASMAQEMLKKRG